jgi:hypothetical protein
MQTAERTSMTDLGASAVSPAALSQLEMTDARAKTARPGMAGVHLRLTVLVLVLLCVQVAIFVLFAEKRLSAVGYILAHLASCLAAWSVRRSVGKRAGVKQTSVCILQILAWTAFAGPFGTIVSAGLLIPARRGPTAEQRDAGSGPSPGLRHNRRQGVAFDIRLQLRTKPTVRPLIDVIAEGTQTEKFEALRIIARRYDPGLAPALRCALADGSAPVRVLAATVIAKQRMVYLEKVGALLAEMAGKPDRPQPLRKLARARLELAESGLLDAPRVREEIALAREELARAAEIEGHATP